MFRSVCALLLALVLAVAFLPICVDAQSSSLASITVRVQTFGKPSADFSANIQIHSPALDSDLTTLIDKPSNAVFPNLPPGAYHVAVSSAALSPAQLDLMLSPGQAVELSLILDRLFPLILEPRNTGASVGDPMGELPMPTLNGTLDSLLMPEPSKPSIVPPSDLGACSLDEVLPRVTAHAREFVDNVNRITATELLALERQHKNGKLEESTQKKAHYVANIAFQESRHLTVDEYRDGHPDFNGFMRAVGSTSLILIFHPVHLDEFEITCKGFGTWRGSPVYLLNFQQRRDRPNNMSEFSTPKRSYNVNLKGTAWVDATTYQVVHLETDLLEPIPEVSLDVEHQALDYGPVIFAERNVTLWLPQSVDINVYLGSKQFNAHHRYSGYQLFVVETGQKISKPKEISN